MGLLDGQVALVTGAAGGIGLAVAQAYAAQGARVALADVSDTVPAAAALDARYPGCAMPLRLDVTDEAATEAAYDAVAATWGALGIVVPNAGVLVLQHATEIGAAAWRRVIDVNLTGAFLTARGAARRMGQGGSIIFTSSLFGLRGGVENAAYSASKFGMIGLMQCMAAELAPRGIRANAVCPGQMDTAMIRQLFDDRGALRGVPATTVRGELEARIPMGALGALDQLAETYVYLASGMSRYVTGQSIAVDGGWMVG